ncbi:unnamed protein product [Ranitomeya imitator]|uniref:Uncharacterized protein n=1 Tax=Ranitomeya imitator TaxID=111125 RepID=A0ABN9KUP3_9NEOB|nr:unnamed protein product [Ranitomeya imitator]
MAGPPPPNNGFPPPVLKNPQLPPPPPHFPPPGPGMPFPDLKLIQVKMIISLLVHIGASDLKGTFQLIDLAQTADSMNRSLAVRFQPGPHGPPGVPPRMMGPPPPRDGYWEPPPNDLRGDPHESFGGREIGAAEEESPPSEVEVDEEAREALQVEDEMVPME